MVCRCHETRRRINAEGCDEIKDVQKRPRGRSIKAMVTRQRLWPCAEKKLFLEQDALRKENVRRNCFLAQLVSLEEEEEESFISGQ